MSLQSLLVFLSLHTGAQKSDESRPEAEMGKSRQDSGDSARNTDFAQSKTTRIRVRFLKPSHDPSIPPHMAGRGGVFFLALCRVSRGRWRPRRAMKTAAWVGLGCGANWREPCLRRRHQRHGQRGPGQRRRSLLGILQTPRTIPPLPRGQRQTRMRP